MPTSAEYISDLINEATGIEDADFFVLDQDEGAEFVTKKLPGSVLKDAAHISAGTLNPDRTAYSEDFDYTTGQGTTENGIQYVALQDNGPGTVVKSPAANPDYWEATGGGGSGAINFLVNPCRSQNLTGITRSTGSLAWSTTYALYGGGAVFADELLSGQTIDIDLDDVDAVNGGQSWAFDIGYRLDTASAGGTTMFADGELTACLLDGANEIQGGNIPISTGGVFRTQIFVWPSNTLTGLKLRIKAAGTSKACDLRIADVSVRPQQEMRTSALTGPTAYTPTFGAGFGTVTNIDIEARRSADQMLVTGVFKAGTIAGSAATLTLYGGLTALVNSAPSSMRRVIGRWWSDNANNGTQKAGVLHAANASDVITFGMEEKDAATAPVATAGNNANAFFATGQIINISLTVPISQWSSSIQVSGEVVEWGSNSDVTATANPNSDGGLATVLYGLGNASTFGTGWAVGTNWIRRVKFRQDIVWGVDSLHLFAKNLSSGAIFDITLGRRKQALFYSRR